MIHALANGRISHLFLLTHNLSAMLAFYRDTLGFAVAFAQEGAFAFLRLPRNPDLLLALYPGRAPGPAPAPHCFLVVDVDDIAATAARLRAHGVAVGPIAEVPYGRAAMVTDPEGNLIEIHEPAPSA